MLLENKICFARHATTDWNKFNLLQGKNDQPLSNEGILLAQNTARKLPPNSFACIVTSSLKRAVHTAQIYGDVLKIEIRIEPGISELDHGLWEGKDFTFLQQNNYLGFHDWFADPRKILIPGGSESIYSAAERFNEVVSRYSTQQKNKGQILFLTHKHIFALYKTYQSELWGDFNKQNLTIFPFAI